MSLSASLIHSNIMSLLDEDDDFDELMVVKSTPQPLVEEAAASLPLTLPTQPVSKLILDEDIHDVVLKHTIDLEANFDLRRLLHHIESHFADRAPSAGRELLDQALDSLMKTQRRWVFPLTQIDIAVADTLNLKTHLSATENWVVPKEESVDLVSRIRRQRLTWQAAAHSAIDNFLLSHSEPRLYVSFDSRSQASSDTTTPGTAMTAVFFHQNTAAHTDSTACGHVVGMPASFLKRLKDLGVNPPLMRDSHMDAIETLKSQKRLSTAALLEYQKSGYIVLLHGPFEIRMFMTVLAETIFCTNSTKIVLTLPVLSSSSPFQHASQVNLQVSNVQCRHRFRETQVEALDATGESGAQAYHKCSLSGDVDDATLRALVHVLQLMAEAHPSAATPDPETERETESKRGTGTVPSQFLAPIRNVASKRIRVDVSDVSTRQASVPYLPTPGGAPVGTGTLKVPLTVVATKPRSRALTTSATPRLTQTSSLTEAPSLGDWIKLQRMSPEIYFAVKCQFLASKSAFCYSWNAFDILSSTPGASKPLPVQSAAIVTAVTGSSEGLRVFNEWLPTASISFKPVVDEQDSPRAVTLQPMKEYGSYADEK